jgi:hypothetical protein
MDKNLNELLVARVLDNIPKNLKAIEYLMDSLEISRESAYRRLRGEISFAFDEIAKLAVELNFSVDDIVGNNTTGRVFFDLKVDTSADPEKSFYEMIKEYHTYVDNLSRAKETESLASINRISLFLLVRFDNLFKFYYYKWIHQTYNVPIDHLFSETVLSKRILDIQEDLKIKTAKISNINFILDRDIFLAIVREVQYYFKRELITSDEILVLKNELIELLDHIDNLIQNGICNKGNSYNFYLSLLDIEMNSSFSFYDGKVVSQLWLYSVNCVIIKDQEICNMHRKWIESLKKCAILITQSNEMLQTEFILRQRTYIDSISNDLYYYD